LIWSFATGGFVTSSPAIGIDGTIYVGSYDFNLYAINPDGTLKWSFPTGHVVESSPAIGSDGTIYVGSRNTKLHAINPNGTEKWSFKLPNNQWVRSSPTIGLDGTIYVPSNHQKLYAININGTEKWNFTVLKSWGISSTAISIDGTIYAGNKDCRLYAINLNGTEKWNFTAGDGISSSPSIGNDGTIYFGSHDHRFYAINQDGSEKWNFSTGDIIFSSPAIGSDGTIYFGSYDGKIYAVNSDGTQKWNFTTGVQGASSPAIGSDGTIFVGSYDNKLYALNPNGTERWNASTDGLIYSSPAIGSDGIVYVGSDDGKLYAIGLEIEVISYFTTLNSAAQSKITVKVAEGTTPISYATVTLSSDNGGLFNPQNGVTDSNGVFTSIFNAPTVTTETICKITAKVSKSGYYDGEGHVDVTLIPTPWPMFGQNHNHTGQSPYDTSTNNGKLKWSFKTESRHIHSSPAIGTDDTIYFGSLDKNLYAINPNGSKKWDFTTGGEIYSSPAIGSDGTIYISSGDNNLYAIHPNGTPKWSFSIGSITSSSPAIGSDGTIYTGSHDNNLYAINPDGTLKWRFMTGGILNSSPAIWSDGTIYVNSYDNNLYAINPDGTEKWRFLTNGFDISPAIGADGIIYIGSNEKKLWAIYPNGTDKWNFTAGGNVDSTAISSDGTIYISSHDAKLYAINPDGTKKWSFTTGQYLCSLPAIGSDGTIYVGSMDHKLYAINPDGTEKWNFTTGDFIHSSPAIDSDGTIYIGSSDYKLYAIGNPYTPPIADAGPDQTVHEGDLIQFDGSATHQSIGSITSFKWDFDSSDGLWWETGAAPDATGPTPTNTYGDDGVYVVTLRITDSDDRSATDTCNITVLNVNPKVEIESTTMQVEVGLRVTGRKFNDVGMTLCEEGNSIGYISIERMPGSPNDQMAWIPVTLDMTKTHSATITYTPEDPPNIGGNPVWVYIKFPNSSIQKIHHTFNVQQSKKRDSGHWNHVEPWEVDLNAHLIGWEFEVDYHVTDPGSDDEILTLTYGSQNVEVSHLNDPPNPDPFPSPEVNPRGIVGTTTLVYEGPGTLTMIAKDDDNIRLGAGLGTDSINLS
jgi:outer membrane protein assembly factor BamB